MAKAYLYKCAAVLFLSCGSPENERRKIMNSSNERDILINELLRIRHSMGNGQFKMNFGDLRMSEYLVLKEIASADENGLYEGKTYLMDLAASLDQSIRKTAKTVRKLRDRGLIFWEHDGDGEDGTYVLITEDGRSLLENREEHIRRFFSRVIDNFGRDDTKKLLRMLKEFETVMRAELEGDEEDEDES